MCERCEQQSERTNEWARNLLIDFEVILPIVYPGWEAEMQGWYDIPKSRGCSTSFAFLLILCQKHVLLHLTLGVIAILFCRKRPYHLLFHGEHFIALSHELQSK